jgi:hypothetical protein
MLLAALVLVLAACSNSFTPAAVSSSVTGTETAAAIAARAVTTPVTITVSSSGLTAGATTKGYLRLVINADVSSTANLASLKSSLVVYPLTTSTATTAYTRGTAITLPDPEVLVTNNSTTLNYYIDMSSYPTTGANVWEVFIPGGTLFDGQKVLDFDNDKVLGEAGDDDFIDGSTIIGNTTAIGVGNFRLPQSQLGVAWSAITGATLAPTVTFTDVSGGGVVPTLTGSTITSLFSIETFDPSSSTWKAVTTTNTYNAATAVLTLTLGAVLPVGAYYRTVEKTPYLIAETVAVNDYLHRANYGKLSVVNGTPFAIGVAADAKQSGASYTATAKFDNNNQNGWIQLTFNGQGTKGLLVSSMTADNVKLYDTNLKRYIPISGFALVGTTNSNLATSVRFNLPATYTKVFHGFHVYIGPGVKDNMALDATSDDFNLGDWNNVPGAIGTSFPYLFQEETGTAGSFI